MTYRAPLDDILLELNQGAGLRRAIEQGHCGNYDADTTAAVLKEATRFAEDVLAPLNRDGDKVGAKFTTLVDADGKAFAEVGKEKMPRTFVLDADGKIVWFDISYTLATRRELHDSLRVLTGDSKQK